MVEKYLGELGTSYEEVEVTFGYFGAKIRAHPAAGELAYLDFLEEGSKIDEKDEMKSFEATMKFLKKQVHEDDWEVFWDLAHKHRQSVKDIIMISQTIMEAVSGFPTGQPSDSATGPSRKERRLKAVSSSAPEVFRHLNGRPDLKEAHAKAQLAN